jgi:hypothetical protein
MIGANQGIFDPLTRSVAIPSWPLETTKKDSDEARASNEIARPSKSAFTQRPPATSPSSESATLHVGQARCSNHARLSVGPDAYGCVSNPG